MCACFVFALFFGVDATTVENLQITLQLNVLLERNQNDVIIAIVRTISWQTVYKLKYNSNIYFRLQYYSYSILYRCIYRIV